MIYRVSGTTEMGTTTWECQTADAAIQKTSELLHSGATDVFITDENGEVHIPAF
jgi:hypothetical protein